MSAALLDAYAAAWATGRAAAIAAFWAPQDFRFYKAEEVAEPFTAWADTEAYWRANEAIPFRRRQQLPDHSWPRCPLRSTRRRFQHALLLRTAR